jgi:transcriptional regulator with XRE-family HTH domain
MEKSIYSKEYSLFLEQLRNAREEKGLTQTEVAERLGQTQSFVSKVERGERRLDVVELRAFCYALGVGLPSFVNRIERALHGK